MGRAGYRQCGRPNRRRPSSQPDDGHALDSLLFEQCHELRRLGNLEQATRYIILLTELRDLAEDREVLVGYLERRSNDQEEEIDGFVVNGSEVDALFLATEGHAQAVDDERAAMRDRDATANPGRSEILSPLQHLEQHPLGLFVELEQPDQFLQDLVLAGALQFQLDGVFRKKLSQFHSRVS